ncbi:MAG: hypothetical protein LAP38_17115 [Acidobacteriia bacterium]|nr:hypothetical protein [Terriglobia bacterium]
MKRFILGSIVSAGCALAQTSTSATNTVDINGRRVYDGAQSIQSKSGNQTVTTQTLGSINGRQVPLERVEERVIRDDASGRVVERTIQKYDPQGNPTTPVKETVQVEKRPDGSSTTQTSTYRQDINGHMQLAEKSVTEVRTSGSTETAETAVQRPTINGSVETVEKLSDTKVKDASGSYREEAVTYRKDAGGGFYTAMRKSTEHTQQGSQSSDNTAEYEVGASGQLELHGQTVSKTVEQPDGSKSIVMDVFGKGVPGTVDAGGSSLKLQEQQIIERKKGPSDTVVETVDVRRPSVADPKTLGPARQLSETVCKGNCKP